MDLSHLRDELANPQMAAPPGQRATHPALSAQFKQTAFHLTSFWRSALRASEHAYHAGYLAALGDVSEMLARWERAAASASLGSRLGVGAGLSEDEARLRNYLVARMEAVAEDVKATAPSGDGSGVDVLGGGGGGGGSLASTAASTSTALGPGSSQASHLPAAEPASSPVRPARYQSDLHNDINSSPKRDQAPAFISSVSAFSRPTPGATASTSGPTPVLSATSTTTNNKFGSGTALGSGPSPSALWAEGGSNTAARMARLQFGLPHMRSRSATGAVAASVEDEGRGESAQSKEAKDMETESANSAAPSSSTSSRAGAMLIERVAQARAARANKLSSMSEDTRSTPPPPPSSSEPSSFATTRAQTPPTSSSSMTSTSTSAAMSPLRQVQPTASIEAASPIAATAATSSAPTSTATAFSFTSPSHIVSGFSSIPMLNFGSPTTTAMARFGSPSVTAKAAPPLSRPNAKMPAHAHNTSAIRTSSAFSQRAAQNAHKDYGSTDDDGDRSDGNDSDVDLGPLRMPMIRRRPPSAADMDGPGGSGRLGASAGVTGAARPRKRRK